MAAVKRLILAAIVLTGCHAATGFGYQETPSVKKRDPNLPIRYDGRPLRREFFRGEAGPDDQLFAYARTDIRFEHKFKFSQIGGRFLIQLVEIDVHAVFLPKESWLKKSASTAVIDHEQGHFDITQIYALKAEEDILAKRRSYTFTALSRSAAEVQLNAKLRETIRKRFKECVEKQRIYDYQTNHGIRADAQRLHRREQRAELAKWKERRERR